MSLSAAKSHLMQATMQIESDRLDDVEHTLAAAEDSLAGLPDEESAPVAAQIAAVRASLAAAGAGHEAAGSVLPAAGTVGDSALRRALPLLREIEDLVATDPFAGLDRSDADRKSGDLHSLRSRITLALDAAPRHDPEVLDAVRRLEATDVKIAVADAMWARAGLHAEVQRFWSMIREEIDGWAWETSDAGPLEQPRLPRTRLAIQRVAYLLADPKSQQARADAAEADVEAVYREADEVFAAAAAKMASTFEAVLDEADRMPVPAPESTFELDKPRMLATAAEGSLAGTPYLDATVARARGLDARWKAEVAAVRQARQDLYEKLTVEADAAWPGIVAATGASADVDLTDVGRTVLIRGHNRSGWDFHGADFPFALRLHDTAVGGAYEPYVLRALEHARHELKLDVDDRLAWDVVGVVEGRGTIGEKVVRTVHSAETHLELGKVEQWATVDCVRIRIIALHAGPVAVGP